MEDVAERAGFTVGAIYRHFRGKPDLLLAVVAAALQRIPLFQSDGPPRGRVSQAIGVYATPQAEMSRRLAREVHTAARRDRRVRKLLDAFNRRVRAALTARIATAPGADPVASAAITADVLLLMVVGLAHLDTLAPDRRDRPEFRAAVEEAVERILRPESSAGPRMSARSEREAAHRHVQQQPDAEHQRDHRRAAVAEERQRDPHHR
jgi:TetR/AcrR family transcriptional regulator